jgi:hypothetical protein
MQSTAELAKHTTKEEEKSNLFSFFSPIGPSRLVQVVLFLGQFFLHPLSFSLSLITPSSFFSPIQFLPRSVTPLFHSFLSYSSVFLNLVSLPNLIFLKEFSFFSPPAPLSQILLSSPIIRTSLPSLFPCPCPISPPFPPLSMDCQGALPPVSCAGSH